MDFGEPVKDYLRRVLLKDGDEVVIETGPHLGRYKRIGDCYMMLAYWVPEGKRFGSRGSNFSKKGNTYADSLKKKHG